METGQRKHTIDWTLNASKPYKSCHFLFTRTKKSESEVPFHESTQSRSVLEDYIYFHVFEMAGKWEIVMFTFIVFS